MAWTRDSETFLERVCTLTGSLFGACTLYIYNGIMFFSAEKVMICILEVITVFMSSAVILFSFLCFNSFPPLLPNA